MQPDPPEQPAMAKGLAWAASRIISSVICIELPPSACYRLDENRTLHPATPRGIMNTTAPRGQAQAKSEGDPKVARMCRISHRLLQYQYCREIRSYIRRENFGAITRGRPLPI